MSEEINTLPSVLEKGDVGLYLHSSYHKSALQRQYVGGKM